MRVRKTVQSEATRDEDVIRRWLAEMINEEAAREADLEDLLAEGHYFLRDDESLIVYVVSGQDFDRWYEVVKDDIEKEFRF